MHSTELRSDGFAFTLAGAPATFDIALPGFEPSDRLGVVVRRPCGAVGASTLLLAAVTAFYDAQRARGPGFHIYPDFFLFHVGGPLGDHSMLDVHPSHKEVVVAAGDAEALLRAINDRAVTWLLVEDRAPGSPELSREAVAGARDRIKGAFAYDAGGRVAAGDLRVAGNATTESYVGAVLDPRAHLAAMGRDAADPYAATIAARAGEVDEATRARLRAERERLLEDGRPVETYRRLTLDEALALL